MAILLWPPSSWGDSSDVELDRWLPSLAIRSYIISQSTEGSLLSNQRPQDAPGSPLSGDGRLADPGMGVAIEVMTPALVRLPGSPRAFLHGGASYTFASKLTLVQEGAPGELVETPVDPFDPANPSPQTQSEPPQTVIGQGTRTSAETGPLSISAGAGIAFSFDIAGRRVRLKPSFEYFREEVEGTGLMQNVSGQRISVDGVVVTPFDYTILSGKKKKTLHGLGGGLEIEMDAARAGPIALSIFADTQFYSLLGNRSLEFSSTDGVNSTDWSVTVDRLMYRAGVGLRFRYLPE